MRTKLSIESSGKRLAVVTSERAARAIAREELGCSRASEYLMEDGWCLYPSGDRSDDGPIIRVRVI